MATLKPSSQPSMHFVVHDDDGKYSIQELAVANLQIEYGYFNGYEFVTSDRYFGSDDLAALEGFRPAAKSSFEAIRFTNDEKEEG